MNPAAFGGQAEAPSRSLFWGVRFLPLLLGDGADADSAAFLPLAAACESGCCWCGCWCVRCTLGATERRAERDGDGDESNPSPLASSCCCRRRRAFLLLDDAAAADDEDDDDDENDDTFLFIGVWCDGEANCSSSWI